MNNITITNQYDADELKERINETFHSIIIQNNTYQSIILPDNIKCDNFNAEQQKNLVLPNNLKIRTFLYIPYSNVNSIPDDLFVGRTIIASNIKNDIYIPENFTTNSINLYNSRIKKIPKNLSVLNNLNISCTNIKEIPFGTYIGGKVIYNSNVINLEPYNNTTDELYVNGYIMQSNFSTPNIIKRENIYVYD